MKFNINDFLPNTSFECDYDELLIGICIKALLKDSEFQTGQTRSVGHFSDVWCYVYDTLINREGYLISDSIVHEFNSKFTQALFDHIAIHSIFDNLKQGYSQYLSDEDYKALDPKRKFIQDLFTNTGTLRLSLFDFLTRLSDYQSSAARVMDFVGVVDVYEVYDEQRLEALYKDIELALMAGDVEGALQLVMMEIFGVREF